MKMFYGNTPVNSLNIKHYELNTNDATLKASDMQSGITAYARGQKVTGTGKALSFANYGVMYTNIQDFVPEIINVIEIASVHYPVRNAIALNDMRNVDFSVEQTIGSVVVDGIEYPITTNFNGMIFTLNCEKTIALEVFYGKDNYV